MKAKVSVPDVIVPKNPTDVLASYASNTFSQKRLQVEACSL